jgi:hypothetical protein
MNDKQKQSSVSEAERMTPNEVLVEGWHLTIAIFALKGLEIPDTIQSLIDGARQVRAMQLGLAESEGPAGRRRATAPRRQGGCLRCRPRMLMET